MSNSPVSEAMRLYRLQLYRWLVVFVVVAIIVLWKGVPHVQTTYTYTGGKTNGWVPAQNKTSAWYISVTGWKEIDSWEYDRTGLTMILFVPLSDCVDFSAMKDRIVSSITTGDES